MIFFLNFAIISIAQNFFFDPNKMNSFAVKIKHRLRKLQVENGFFNHFGNIFENVLKLLVLGIARKKKLYRKKKRFIQIVILVVRR